MVVVDRQTDTDGQDWLGTWRGVDFRKREKQHSCPALPQPPAVSGHWVPVGNAEPGPGRTSGCFCYPPPSPVPLTPQQGSWL